MRIYVDMNFFFMLWACLQSLSPYFSYILYIFYIELILFLFLDPTKQEFNTN